jgi:hypothetical protein
MAIKHRFNATYLIAACAIYTWAIGGFYVRNASAQALQTASSVSTTAAISALSAPSDAASRIDGAKLIGAGRLKFWGFDVYDARLWAPGDFVATDYATQAFALDITYLRDFSQDDVVQRSLQEMRDLAPISDTQATQWQAQLRKSLPNIRKGDRLVGIYTPGEGASFSVNGKALPELRDPELARIFFSIWLSPRTSAPALRKALIGTSANNKATP